MAFEYEDVLRQWGFSSYLEKFIDEGITDESFALLDDETINVLIGKIGPKLIFKNKYKEYLLHRNSYKGPELDPESNRAQDSTSEISQWSAPSTSIGSVDDSHNSDIVHVPTEKDLQELFNDLTDDNVIELEVLKPPNLKKRRHDSLFPGGLESVLNKYPDGRLVLGHKHKLNNDLRQKISRIIINELLMQNKNGTNFDIPRSSFVLAAKEVAELFPGEQVETFYIPFSSSKGGLRNPARGKLWARYLNVRAALRIANRSDDREKRSDFFNENSQEIENSLAFLKCALEPFHKILKAWEDTFQQRTKLYKNATISDIFSTFPCLKLQFGIELLESDFNHMYEDKVDIIYRNWPKVAESIIKEANERHIEHFELNDLDVNLKALLLLPYLFSPITIKKGKGALVWRPTRMEVQESFFFHTETYVSLLESIGRRKAKCARINIPLQPFGVGIGPTLNSIEKYFVIIDENIKYTCDSSIRCLELLFKLYYSLNFEYSPENKNLWHFIQELVFELPATGKHSSTASVIADVSFHFTSEK